MKEAVGLYGENSLYYRDLAIAMAKRGDVREAKEMLERAVGLGLEEDSIYMVQGEISCAEGEYEAAEGHLNRAISYTEDETIRRRAVLLCDRAYRELGSGWIDQEISFLEQEENREGGASSAMYVSEQLADAYARKAELVPEYSREYYGKALERFRFLYEQGYATGQIMENIAILYEQMGDYAHAKEMLVQMTEQYPDRYEGYKRLAYLEADIQQGKENHERDYRLFEEYYNRAKELYTDQEEDQEMWQLDALMRDLKEGNWL